MLEILTYVHTIVIVLAIHCIAYAVSNITIEVPPKDVIGKFRNIYIYICIYIYINPLSILSSTYITIFIYACICNSRKRQQFDPYDTKWLGQRRKKIK